MTFFYNLNKKLDEIRATPSTTHGQLNERDMSRAAKGYEKYGKEGMEALAKAGREGKALDPVRAKYDKYDNKEVDEGLGDVAKKIGGAVKKVAGKALDTLGHGSDEDMIRDLQKKAGMPQHGKKGMAQPNEGAAPMSAKQKSFAALAEPKDKITFADKIAGAKKEVDEMLGDVAAEAMKQALGGGKKVVADEASDNNAFTAHKRPRVEKPAVGTITHGRKHDVEEIPGGRRVTRRVDPSGISVGADDEAAQSGEKRGRGRPKGPAKAPERVTGGATKHKGGRQMAKEGDNESDEIKQAMAMLKKAGYKVSKAADGAEQVDEKAVSKKQQRFMGMVHATQKGEKAPSKEVAKVAKSMGKKDAEDFASTKHKGLPEKKKSEGKKKEVEETSDNKSSGGMTFGKGIYDSLNRDLEDMIAESMSRLDESMNISMSMNNDDQMGGAKQSLTVTATDEDAMKLGQLLKMAGLGGEQSSGCGCGSSPCSCGSNAEVVDENEPNWPTNTETSDDAMQYSGGLNKPKSTGQTTIPVIASQDDRQESYAEAEEDAIKRMMEMAGMSQNNRLDEGIMDTVKSLVPKAMKLLGGDTVAQIAQQVKQATGGDFTPSRENAIKVAKALGFEEILKNKVGQEPQGQLAEAWGLAGNWQGKLIQLLYSVIPAAGIASMAGVGPGGILGWWLGSVGLFLLTFADTFFSTDTGMVGAMGREKPQDVPKTNPYKGQGGYTKEQTDLDRMMEMAGVKKKEVEEEKTEEGNLFTGNLAKARAAGKKEADLDGDGDMEKVDEGILSATTNLWKAYKG